MPSVTISSSNYVGQTANIVLYGSNAVITNIGGQTLPYVYTNQYVYGTYHITFPDLTECEFIVPPPCELFYTENYTGQTNGARISYDSNNGGIFIYYDGTLENVNYGDSIYITPIENTGTLYYIPPINGQYDLTFTTNGTIYFDFYNFYSLNNIEIINNQTLQYISSVYFFTNPFLTGITISNLPNFYQFGNTNWIYLNYFSYLEKVDFSFLPQINFLDLSSNVISDINITGTPITFLNISYNNLSVNSQNHILRSLYENGIPFGYLDMSFQSNNLCPDLNDPEIYNYYTGLTNNLGWTIYYGPVCNNFPTPTPTLAPTSTPTPTPTLPPLSPNTFVSVWETNSPNQTIELPLQSGGTYNFNVNWGDGSPIETVTAYTNNSHTYLTLGLYNVVISGTCNGWNFNNSGTPSLIKKIRQWANLKISNSPGVFKNCTNLDLSDISDTLDLYGITDLSEMFENCTSLTSISSIGNWNVSGVTDMSNMFKNATSFNQPIGNWNVGNVTNMAGMFNIATSFNNGGSPSISGWNVSNVTTMNAMFSQSSFNQPIGNWDVSNVTDMISMFYSAVTFNQNIGNWNVSGVTNMYIMFSNNTSFNQDIGNWDVSNVTNMYAMFQNATSFNNGGSPSISGWNVSNVTTMNAMFSQSSFNQPIGNWNVGNVTNMAGMFSFMNFNQNIGNWNVSNVTTMQSMFQVNPFFNQPIGNWNVSNVTNMGGMFLQSYDFNRPLSGWNVSNVTNMGGMFLNAWNFNQYIGNWNVSNVTNMDSMFFSALNFNQDLSMWCVTNIPTEPSNFSVGADSWTESQPFWGTCPTPPPFEFGQPAFISLWQTTTPNESITLPLENTFTYNFNVNWGDGSPIETVTAYTNNSHTYVTQGSYTITISGTCSGFTFNNSGSKSKIKDILQWGNLKLGNTGSYFYGCNGLTGITATDIPDLTNTTNLYSMFESCTSLTFINNINNWNVSGVTDMGRMFLYVPFNQDIGNWNVGNVTNMEFIFASTSFNNGGSPSISGWNVSNVTNMQGSFSLNPLFNQPIGNWDVSNVTNMFAIFSLASTFNQNIGNWDISNLNSTYVMFNDATSFNNGGSPSISGWNVSNVTFAIGMFEKATSFNQPIGNWDVSNIYEMSYLFSNATSFNQPLSGWNVSNVTNMNSMFSNATSFNQPIGNWDVRKVTFMPGMFGYATSFNQDISDWIITGFTSNSALNNFMLGKSSINYNSSYYDNMLQKWSSLPNLRPNVTWNMGTIKYNSPAQVYKNTLTGSPINWVITDGGQV